MSERGGPVTAAGKALLVSKEYGFPPNHRPDNDDGEWDREVAQMARLIAAIEAEAVRDWLQSPEAEKALAEVLPRLYPTAFPKDSAIHARFILAALREAQ